MTCEMLVEIKIENGLKVDKIKQKTFIEEVKSIEDDLIIFKNTDPLVESHAILHKDAAKKQYWYSEDYIADNKREAIYYGPILKMTLSGSYTS